MAFVEFDGYRRIRADRTIDGICCIQAVEVGRFNSIRDMQRSESDALSYVFVPGYAEWPCIKNELSHPLLRTFFGLAIFGAPPTCAAGLGPATLFPLTTVGIGQAASNRSMAHGTLTSWVGA